MTPEKNAKIDIEKARQAWTASPAPRHDTPPERPAVVEKEGADEEAPEGWGEVPILDPNVLSEAAHLEAVKAQEALDAAEAKAQGHTELKDALRRAAAFAKQRDYHLEELREADKALSRSIRTAYYKAVDLSLIDVDLRMEGKIFRVRDEISLDCIEIDRISERASEAVRL